MTFQVIKTKEIPVVALENLKLSIERNPLDIDTMEGILEACGNEVYLVMQDDEIYGTIFMGLTTIKTKKYLNIISYGGKEMRRWKKMFYEYAVDLMKQENAELCIITQSKAWGKLFGLKTIGYVYTL